MYDALDRAKAPLNLAALAPLRDGATEAPLMVPPSRRAPRLLRWLVPAYTLWRGAAGPGPLDEHTLNDIGLTRIEMLYSGPKK